MEKKMLTLKSNLVNLVFVLFVFFPYLKIIPLPTDNQPYALLCSIFIVLKHMYKEKKINRNFLLLLYLVIFAFVVAFFNGLNVVVVRSLVNYCSLFFISYATFLIFLKGNIIKTILLKKIINVWLIVGLIQKFFYINFLTNFLNRVNTTSNRGVTSLAPEPTFYGIVCIFLLFFSIYYIKEKKYILICFFQIFFLSKSSMVILFLLIYLVYYIFFNIRRKNIFKIILIILIPTTLMVIVFIKKYSDTRVVEIFSLLLKSPKALLLTDASTNDRAAHVYYSIKGAVENFFIPHGFVMWKKYLANEIMKQDVFWWVSISDRIMSGYGAALYELGFLGFIIPFVFLNNLYKYFKKNADKMTNVCFFSTIMFSAIPLAFPILSFFLGFLIYENEITSTQKKSIERS